MGKLKDLLGLGSPIVDVSSYGTDQFLDDHGLIKGSMTLVDLDTISNLRSTIGTYTETSGGSVANTILGFSLLGGNASYVGKISNDRMGQVFKADLESNSVLFHSGNYSLNSHTSMCLVIITPEGERTMATYLGASIELNEDDIDPKIISDHTTVYIEGYLFDAPASMSAIVKVCDIAKANGQSIALGLSDSFCVDRNRNAFEYFIDKYVDILFSNEREIISLYRAEDIDVAIRESTLHCETVVTTLGPNGSVISNAGDTYAVKPVMIDIDKVIDTNGAGDLYASGFLYGITHGYDFALCGRIGSASAGYVISQIGARPGIGFRDSVHNVLGNNKV